MPDTLPPAYMSDTENGVVDKKENFESNGPHVRRAKCPWCHESFSKNTAGTVALLHHKKTQHFWGRFKCTECNFIAHFAKELVDHKHEEEHLEEVTIKCPKCKIKFPMEELASHYEACVSEENTICPWCGKEFRGTASGTFDQHRKRKHFWGFFR